ncbi:MAG: GntR family transcriptional regulator [Lachnospiraceae bacterium]|nr:GntR family transcriptional regulator [Lachnospiraceae bacterium]
MLIEIDFQSEEALYMQLRNQIVLGIARSVIQEGDALPSVRRLAEDIGINMHTVNKAYAVLREEGFVTIDRRRGAVIAVNDDCARAREEMRERLRIMLAKGICKNISRADVHAMVDDIYGELLSENGAEIKIE